MLKWERVGALLLVLRTALLTLFGLIALCAAAWGFDYRAGLAATGVACLVLEWLSRPDPKDGRT